MNDIIEQCALAMEAAKCPCREGPFGGYDYGHNNDKPVEGGRYVIRDFRDPASDNWGKWIHQTDDRDVHDAEFDRMTQRHIARAVLAKFKELTAEPTQSMIEAMQKAVIDGRDIQTAATEQMWNDIGI